MKRIFKFGIFTLLIIGLSACHNWWHDNYWSSSDRPWVGFGVIHVSDGSNRYTVEMDNGVMLFPGYYNANQFNKLEDKDRVLVNYNIIGNRLITGEKEEYDVRVNKIEKVLYKGILDITPAIEDSIGNDPINVRNIWKIRNMVTFELGYYINSGTHFINLVKQPGEITSEDQPIQLELRHNKNGDKETYHMDAFVTFDLSSLQIAGQDSVAYVINGKNYRGEDYSYKGVYRYTNDSSKSIDANKSVLEEFELR